MSKLVVISHTPHFRGPEENETLEANSSLPRLRGWGPTVRELDSLAELFSTVVHIAPVSSMPAPESSREYESPIRVVQVATVGGRTAFAKLGVLAAFPSYLRVIRQECRDADVIHVRSPAAIALVALLYLALSRRPGRRWVKYAGNWSNYVHEPMTYRFQKWFLKRSWHGAQVTINTAPLGVETLAKTEFDSGSNPQELDSTKDHGHIHGFLNPCIDEVEVQHSLPKAQEKIRSGLSQSGATTKLLFAGSLTENKGPHLALDALSVLVNDGYSVHLTLAGDGPLKAELETEVERRELEGHVDFLGWLGRDDMIRCFEESHFVVLPSRTEGWPKVLGEGLCRGAVPIATDISAIKATLDHFETGTAVPPNPQDGLPNALASAIGAYIREPERWQKEASAGLAGAHELTYDHYVKRVCQVLEWQAPPQTLKVPNNRVDSPSPVHQRRLQEETS